jgi:hypothetical protein
MLGLQGRNQLKDLHKYFAGARQASIEAANPAHLTSHCAGQPAFGKHGEPHKHRRGIQVY